MVEISEEDQATDARWRIAFGGPVPITGCSALAVVLLDHHERALAAAAAGRPVPVMVAITDCSGRPHAGSSPPGAPPNQPAR